jgi:hypothetical protein
MDIMLLQDIVVVDLEDIPGYTVLYNERKNKRETAIDIRDSIPGKDVEKLPNGPGIACKCDHVTLIYFRSPSGSTIWKEQERFFNNYLLHLLRHNPMF